MSIIQVLKNIYHKLPNPPSTNYNYRKIEPSPYNFLPENPVIYDIGSKKARGGYAFGKPPKDATFVCVDIEDGDGVDLVADAHDLHMVKDNSVDFVTSVSVLEHVRYPQKVVKEIHRILKPGGIIYINVPFVFPFHADPSDFYRFTYKGIDILCEDFEKLDSGFNRGPASTMNHLLVHFFAMLFSFNNKAIYGVNVDIFKWLLFWVKYLDVFLAKYNMAYVIHAGTYFIGRKGEVTP
jgi:SAM-dependent methyltransferase